MKKVCVVSTVELPIKFFMLPHLKALQQYYDLTVIINTDNPDFLKEYGVKANVIKVDMQRDISLFKDMMVLLKLFLLFRKHRYHIIHSIAPKAGLIAMFAGFLARVPIRLHCFTGQVWATSSGIRRSYLKFFDRLMAFCATNILADSCSQLDFLIKERIVFAEKCTVLAAGSVSGVDLERFRPDDSSRSALRLRLGIPQDAVLCLYIGRIKLDKGVLDLASASRNILPYNPNVYMLFVGPDEDNLREEIMSCVATCKSQVYFEGYTKTPEIFMAAADILCLPSYREGFGMVVIEAAAVGIPSLASRIYGVTDAVVDGVTGILHLPGDITEICSKLSELIENDYLRNMLGEQARQRARLLFAQPVVVNALLEYYRRMEADYEAMF